MNSPTNSHIANCSDLLPLDETLFWFDDLLPPLDSWPLGVKKMGSDTFHQSLLINQCFFFPSAHPVVPLQVCSSFPQPFISSHFIISFVWISPCFPFIISGARAFKPAAPGRFQCCSSPPESQNQNQNRALCSLYLTLWLSLMVVIMGSSHIKEAETGWFETVFFT